MVFGNLNCLGIFAPLKNRMLKLKIDITKRILVRIAMTLAIVGAAVLFDVYFENDLDELENIQTESKEHSTEKGSIYIIAQSSTISPKTSGEKSSNRKLKIQLHDKFLRKYHQIRNNQVLQAEQASQSAPVIQSYHYLVFQNYFFTQPDDDPLV